MADFFNYTLTAVENKNLIGKSKRNLTYTIMPF